MTRPDDPVPDPAELRPLGESTFAVAHGFTRSSPDVVVAGPAVRTGREAAGLSRAEVAEAMTSRRFATEAATVTAVEQAPAHRMPPREARLLAAVLDLPLSAIEAAAEPWPAEALAALAGAGADEDGGLEVLAGHVVARTGTGSYLGLLRCPGDAGVLDCRTYRTVAAGLLNGPWCHLGGALLVAADPPHLALAVDALDCVTRSHAPTGVSGFSRLVEPEPVAAAVASYDRAYAISWSDPDQLAGAEGRVTQDQAMLAEHIAALAEQIGDEARRARRPGKRPGYEATERWLQRAEPQQVLERLEELAAIPPGEAAAAGERLGEVLFG